MRKGDAIREMFDRIAARYDLVNTVMTGGVDAAWRRRAVRELGVANDAEILDLCCGTGALTRDCAAAAPRGRVTGIDFSPKMLDRAQALGAPPNVRYLEGDVLELPFADATFDAAVMGFSMRNVVDIRACLAQIVRVLKPGGTFVNLEVSKPPNPVVRRAFYWYFYGLVPLIGRAVGGDSQAYRYLPQSLVNFPDSGALASAFEQSGFTGVRVVMFMGGVACLHIGRTPAVAVRAVEAAAAAAIS